jgi:asparagine synthase (glutamine-hydrolysing)
MCGIAGLLNLDGAPADARLLAAMTATIRHRGPDDEGHFVDGAVGLGSRRLSIIDLSQGGHQPMANEAGTIHVVFNGEIYNFRELRRGLEARGRQFRTSSDTEAIIRCYEEYGLDAVKHLSGMFAFALWDANERRLLIARDHVGVKPLYYYLDGERLLFGSEIRPLLVDQRVSPRLSLQAMDRFLSYYYVPGEETIYEGVKRLPPGHMMICRNRQVEVRPYWQLDPRAEPGGHEGRLADELRARLEGAVERQLVADVPVGVFLSGGLDSSTLVALMAKLGRRDTPTFSIGFSGDAGFFDESADAREVARHFGMEHHTLVVRPDIAELLPQVVRSVEEPLADPSTFLTYLISRAAREHVKVVLTGIGGDELFGGYRRYVGAQLIAGLQRFPGTTVNGLLSRGIGLLQPTEETRLGYHLRNAGRLLDAARQPHPDAYLGMISLFTPAMKAGLYAAPTRAALDGHDPSELYRAHFARPRATDLLGRLFYLDTMTFLPNNLLLFSDKTSMAASLELRVPLLDVDLVEFAARLPARMRVQRTQTKYLLRKAMGPLLPPAVLAKSKQGFTAPVGRWIRRELAGYARQLLSAEAVEARGLWNPGHVATMLAEHTSGRQEWGRQLFGLMVFELWCRTFLDDAPGSDRVGKVRLPEQRRRAGPGPVASATRGAR